MCLTIVTIVNREGEGQVGVLHRHNAMIYMIRDNYFIINILFYKNHLIFLSTCPLWLTLADHLLDKYYK